MFWLEHTASMLNTAQHKEQWRDAVGYETLFSVSNLGRVRSKRTGKILKPTRLSNGYLGICTRIGGRAGKCLTRRVHRMVADAFLGSPPAELVARCALYGHGKVLVRHLDDDKDNNASSNLAWGTGADNSADFMATEKFDQVVLGRSGPKNPNAKATPEMVAAIRARFVKGCSRNGARALAAEFGIHHTNVARIAGQRSYTANL